MYLISLSPPNNVIEADGPSGSVLEKLHDGTLKRSIIHAYEEAHHILQLRANLLE